VVVCGFQAYPEEVKLRGGEGGRICERGRF